MKLGSECWYGEGYRKQSISKEKQDYSDVIKSCFEGGLFQQLSKEDHIYAEIAEAGNYMAFLWFLLTFLFHGPL